MRSPTDQRRMRRYYMQGWLDGTRSRVARRVDEDVQRAYDTGHRDGAKALGNAQWFSRHTYGDSDETSE